MLIAFYIDILKPHFSFVTKDLHCTNGMLEINHCVK